MARFRMQATGAVLAAVTTGAVLGGALVSLPGNNSVTSGDIKNGAVHKPDIDTDAVGHDEIRRGAVRGDEVDEAKLGKVPTAGRADSAAAADSATTAGNVGGKTAVQLDTRWALIAENGTIERQTGGFTIVNCYTANANCYINAGEDVTNNGISAQIAVANVDGTPISSGETGAAPCGLASVLCAPPGTEAPNVLVVAPRDSAGAVPGGVTPPTAANAARFYVFVTGSEG